MKSDDLYAYAATRGHIIRTVDAARDLDVTPRSVRRVLARDGWPRPFAGIALSPGAPLDASNLAKAALLSVGPPAAISRNTAAHLYGVRRVAPTRVDLLVPDRRHLRPRPGIAVARSRLWRPTDVSVRDGVAMVTGERLLLDIAAVSDRAGLRALAIDLQHRGHLDLDRLGALLSTAGPLTNVEVARQVLADLRAAGRTDSPWEYEIREEAARRGIHFDPGQIPVPLIGGGVIHFDLAVSDAKVAVEGQSWTYHASREDQDRDARRAIEVAKVDDDWRVLPVTWTRWHEDRDAFFADLREVIAGQNARFAHRRAAPTPA